jgi:protein-S-isoprenylcysteine O-methyltransferase Ste14
LADYLMMETLLIALRTVLYMAAFILFFGWLALRVQGWDDSLQVELPPWTRMAGLAFTGLGALLLLACAGTFIARGRGTPAVFDPPRQFVSAGPYKFVRNPMYIGGFLLLAGFGLIQRSLAILLFALALLGLFHLFVVFVEEPGLKKRFGQSYLDYKQIVKRWLPRFL